MSEIVNRIAYYIKEKGLRVSKVESAIGVSNGTLAKAISNNKSIKTETLESFLKTYTEVNPIWLLTGSGEAEMMQPLQYAAEPQSTYRAKKDTSLLQLLAEEVADAMADRVAMDSKKIDYIYNALTKAEFLAELEKMQEQIATKNKKS